MKQENLWLEKARALDRYRWRLLRERHGAIGSALRFARDAFGDWRFGMLAKCHLAKSITTEACDFLLLQSAPKVIALQRKKLLIQALRDRGHALVETALPKPEDIWRQRLLKAPLFSVPTRYFGYASHAEWLVARHAPKILLNDRNGSLYAPFLRLALARQNGLLVQLAHATTLESSPRLSMNDYDYYFLFGQSSVEALEKRTPLFGESRAVLSGSHMIDSAYDLPPTPPSEGAVLILGVGPDKEKEAAYQRTYALLRDWAQHNPEKRVLVKAHPRSQVPFWTKAATALPNLEVLPTDCSLADALGQSGIVINIMSNAVIEAALAKRPVIFVNASGETDIFQQERFLGSRISSREALDAEMENVSSHYVQRQEVAARFAHFHLAEGTQGLQKTLEYLENLLHGQNIPWQPLQEHKRQ